MSGCWSEPASPVYVLEDWQEVSKGVVMVGAEWDGHAFMHFEELWLTAWTHGLHGSSGRRWGVYPW